MSSKDTDSKPVEAKTDTKADTGPEKEKDRAPVSDVAAQVAKAVEDVRARLEEQFSGVKHDLEGKLAESDSALSASRLETERLKAAISAGVDNGKLLEFAALLKGDTGDELLSHAKKLKELFTVEKAKSGKAEDPSQGQANTEMPLNGDPLLRSIENWMNR